MEGVPKTGQNMSSTQQWLRENTRFYTNSSRTYADVDAVLPRYPSLRPKTDVYTYDDGRTQLLLCLHGLLSISYRNASYNIPIAIWLPRDYPKEPPLCYVVATSEMLIRPSRHLEISGRCTIDYIENWHRKSEGCNVLALLEAMQSQFSKEPPVYAKPKDSPQPAPQPSAINQDYSAKPPPPVPQVQSPPPQSAQGYDRPPLPPKPSSSIPNLNGYQANSPASFVPTPPLIASPPPPNVHYHQHPVPPPPTNFSPRSPLPLALNPESTGHDPHRQWSVQPASYNPSGAYSQVSISPPPTQVYHSPPPAHVYQPPPPPQFYQPPPLPPSAQFSPPQSATLSSPPPRDILDEDDSDQQGPLPPVPAVAPPRPPNPELLRLHSQIHGKLTSEFASLSQAMSLDAERLRTHQSDLLTGEPAIRDEMSRLEAVRDVCIGVSQRLGAVVGQGERNVNDLKQKGDPEVDELVCSTTIVHNQLINLIAEDNAIEDTIYHLHRALNAGRIDLERFLRTTRVLAEEQFMKRALIEKIQVRVPLGNWSS